MSKEKETNTRRVIEISSKAGTGIKNGENKNANTPIPPVKQPIKGKE